MVSRIRSSSGCWTCRLRRKKCDEAKPHCSRCTKLQLDCEGYAERPMWMDGGELERLKVEQTKRVVRENMGSSIKRRSVHRQSIGQRTLSDDSISSLPGSLFSHISGSSRTSGEEIGNEIGFRCPDSTTNNDDEPDTSFRRSEKDTGNTLSYPDHGLHDDDKVQGSALLNRQSTPSQAILFTDMYNFPNADDETYDSLFRSPFPNIGSSDSSSAFSSGSSQSRSSNRPSSPEEADLLLHYIEVVCEKQFLMIAKKDRGWLYMSITKTDIVYWATLSLASYHQSSDSLSYFYNNLAILELRKNILLIDFQKTKSLNMILQCCFCMVQLMFLEKLRGNLEACKMHMHAACSLLANFQSAGVANGTLELPTTISGAEPVDSAMLQLVVITLRWFDVLLSCCLRTPPFISSPLLDILQHESDTTQMMGRIAHQVRVAASLADALELDHWKTTAAKAGRLSVVELVKRAAAIESNMVPGQDVIQPGGDQVLQSVTDETIISQVARIFTSTTRVYLQVIVAGSHREVPEISNGVSHTVDLFRHLSGTQMLAHIAWPFCFIGCLATGDDREFVASLADKAVSQNDCTLNVKWASTIIKECWRLLDEEMFVDPDWASAMKSLEYEFVLF